MWALPVGSALVAVVAVSFMRVAIAALVVVILWLRRRIRRFAAGLVALFVARVVAVAVIAFSARFVPPGLVGG